MMWMSYIGPDILVVARITYNLKPYKMKSNIELMGGCF